MMRHVKGSDGLAKAWKGVVKVTDVLTQALQISVRGLAVKFGF